jgi:hypothetical protein
MIQKHDIKPNFDRLQNYLNEALSMQGCEELCRYLPPGITSEASNPFLDTGYWIPDTGCRMLDTGCWILDTGYWILDTGYWMLDAGCWILDAG